MHDTTHERDVDESLVPPAQSTDGMLDSTPGRCDGLSRGTTSESEFVAFHHSTTFRPQFRSKTDFSG